MVQTKKKEVKIIIQKNLVHQKIIDSNLEKASLRDNSESGAEKADNWIHITPKAKSKLNNDNHKEKMFKNYDMAGSSSGLGKSPSVHKNGVIDNVVSTITTSLAAVTIAPIHVTATGKQKIVHYMDCDLSALHRGGMKSDPSNNVVASNPLMMSLLSKCTP